MHYQSGLLLPDQVISGFDCGNADLNEWLHRNARRAHDGGTAKVYVWTPPGSLDIVGYFSICPTEVVREEDGRNEDGLSRSVAGGYSRVPGYLIGRLALSRLVHGQGLGGQLLLDALDRIVAASRISGGRVIVVDAVDDDAHGFYRRFGFTAVRHRPTRLVMKVSTAASALDLPS